jgi:hypothetical protein
MNIAKFFATKYRVVNDNYNGYEVQSFRWWFPMWMQCWASGSITNTFSNLDRAKQFIEIKKARTIIYYTE